MRKFLTRLTEAFAAFWLTLHGRDYDLPRYEHEEVDEDLKRLISAFYEITPRGAVLQINDVCRLFCDGYWFHTIGHWRDTIKGKHGGKDVYRIHLDDATWFSVICCPSVVEASMATYGPDVIQKDVVLPIGRLCRMPRGGGPLMSCHVACFPGVEWIVGGKE